MEIKEKSEITLYKTTDPGNRMVVTLYEEENGNLVIADFDASKGAHERFGGDLEAWLTVDKTNVIELIDQLNQSEIKAFVQSHDHKIPPVVQLKNCWELMNWVGVTFAGIDGKSKFAECLTQYKIAFKETSWPV